jgi:heavy metal sensor kinase
MITSIKSKIIIFYLIVLFVTLSVLGGLLYFSLNRIVYDAVDADLLSRAQVLTALVSGEKEDRSELRSSSEYLWEYGSPKAKSFYQIRRRDGFTLEKSLYLKDSEFPYAGKADKPIFRTIQLKGIPLRLVDFPVPADREIASNERHQGFVIQCAEDIGGQVEILRHYGIALFVSLFVVMVVSTFGGVVISRKALAPVKNISETIDAISESNLSERIKAEAVPKELRVLASSFNRTVDRLESAFRRQNQFAADASHELRTPLSVILSQSEVALRKDRAAEEYRTALIAIMKTAQKMSATVRKLLTVNRLLADKGALNHETLDLAAIIDASVRLLIPLAERKRVHVQMPRTEGQMVVQGDKDVLLELFTNLLDNAIKYNVAEGMVQIIVRKEEEFIHCEIKDTGIGIPDDDREKVFDRFYRVDPSRSQEIEGSGLGLSICKEIVKLYGGRIEIKSEAGRGTSVSVYLKKRLHKDR